MLRNPRSKYFRRCVLWDLLPCNDYVFIITSHGGRLVSWLLVSYFIRMLISFMGTPPSWPDYLPKTSPPDTIMLGVRLQHMNLSVQFSCSVMSDSLQPHGLQYAGPPCPSPTPGVYPNSCWVGNAIQPSHPLLAPSPHAFNLSQHQDLCKWVSSSHQMAKDWSFSVNISPSNEHPGLISFRMDWLDPLAVQGTLKSLLQHHGSKASILWCSAFLGDANIHNNLKAKRTFGVGMSRHQPCRTYLL